MKIRPLPAVFLNTAQLQTGPRSASRSARACPAAYADWLRKPNPFTWAVASAFALPLMGQHAVYGQALPTGGVVSQGTASISTNGIKMTVTNTPGTNINWQSFNIGVDITVQFVQQDASSMVFNRVTSSTPSSILGSLISNGKVFLINPNGVTIGHGAYIDTAAFVASSLGIKIEDLMAGKFKFENGAGSGKVANYGTIVTQSGGFVYFVGKDVENHGVIHTPKGEIILAAGNTVEIINPKSPDLRVEISANGNEAVNLGKLIASGGTIGMFAGNLRHSGVAQASTAEVNAQGRIVFRAKQNVTLDAGSRTEASGPTAGKITIQAETGTATVRGSVEAIGTATPALEQNLPQSQTGITLARENTLTITPDMNGNGVSALLGKVNMFATAKTVAASASQANSTVTSAPTNDLGKGGVVEILAPEVVIAGRAVVDASGETGGGVILAGGDLQGKNPDVPNARKTIVRDDAVLRASALLEGNGGKVIVWADVATHFVDNATIVARGGMRGGNGGFAEVSGKDMLYFSPRGAVDLRAPNGLSGTLLLDPANVNIATAGENLNGGTFNGNETFDGAAGTAVITWATITTQLGSGNVIITTSGTGGVGDITFVAGIANLNNNNNNLTFLANNNIVGGGQNIAVTSGIGNLTMRAGWSGSSTSGSVTNPTGITAGTGTITLGDVTTLGGSINLTAGSTISTGVLLTGATAATGGAVNLTGSSVSAGNINTTSINGTGGNVNVSATGAGGSIALAAITASGQGAGAGSGRSGGVVSLHTTNGTINTSGITSTGAAGTSGTGGAGGAINITSGGAGNNVVVGAVNINGGLAVDTAASAGGAGGAFNLTASGAATVVSVNSAGGGGSDVGGNAGAGGIGGLVQITASGGTLSVTAGITASGGAGGNATSGNSSGAVGGTGGTVTLLSSGLMSVGSGINTSAGSTGTSFGGDNGVNGLASNLGNVNLSASAGGISIANINTGGGGGGNAGASASNNGGTGGNAATVTLNAAGPITQTGAISSAGGSGGTGTAGGTNGDGGNANVVSVTTTGTVTGLNVSATGGAAGGGAGAAGNAGNGAAIGVTGNSIAVGALNASGNTSAGLTINEAGTGSQTGVFTGTTLTKTGAGKFTLSQANVHTGTTTVSAGTLAVTHASGLGGTGSGTTVLAGATLEIDGVTVANEALTIQGTGVGGVGALLGSNAAAVSGGTITLAAASTIGASSGGTLNLISTITGNNRAVNTTGTGSIVLAADNSATLTGPGSTITVNSGTLSVTTNGALGSTAAGTTVLAGGTLRLDAGGGTLTYSNAETVTLTSNNATAAVLNATGTTVSFAGNIVAAGGNTAVASQVNSAAGNALTLSGAINANTAGAESLAISGTATSTVSVGVVGGGSAMGGFSAISNALTLAGAITTSTAGGGNGNLNLSSGTALALPVITAAGNTTIATGGTNADITTTGALALNGVTNVITATGVGSDLFLNQAITHNNGSASTLNLRAFRHIFVNTGGSVSSTGGALATTLNADRNGISPGAIAMVSGTFITSNGGAVNLVGGTTASGLTSGVLLSGAQITTAGGNVTIKGQALVGASADGVQLTRNAGTTAITAALSAR